MDIWHIDRPGIDFRETHYQVARDVMGLED